MKWITSKLSDLLDAIIARNAEAHYPSSRQKTAATKSGVPALGILVLLRKRATPKRGKGERRSP